MHIFAKIFRIFHAPHEDSSTGARALPVKLVATQKNFCNNAKRIDLFNVLGDPPRVRNDCTDHPPVVPVDILR